MKKTGLVSRILMVVFIFTTVALLVATIALSVWIAKLSTTVNNNNQQTENMYENALYTTADSLSSIENNIAKLSVTTSKTQAVSYATDLSRTAASAATAASRLPVSMEESVKLEKFLNQISDFSANYAKAVVSGSDTSNYEKQLPDIYEAVHTLKNNVLSITTNLGVDYRLTDHIKNEGNFISGTQIDSGDKESSVEFPTIIYDGPFSDALDEKNFKATENMNEISESEAITIAGGKLGLTAAKVTGISGEGKALIYVIHGEVDGHDAYAGVTKRGGILCEAEIYQNAATPKYDEAYASDFAVEAMLAIGYCEHIKPVWYNSINGIAYINLTPVINDVIYYTDLIVVKVNLETGKLAGFEARGYCSNYVERAPIGIVMNKNAVPSYVSSKLTIESVRLAVIPKGQSEVLCYEVKSTVQGLDFFIYLDAKTGDEVEIMRVINADQGNMVF